MNSSWWPIWIGPQQQHEPGSAIGSKCALTWPILPGDECPTQGCVDFRNITLRRVTVENATLSPGVLLGNSSNPMQVTFEDVVVHEPSLIPFLGNYKCENVHGSFSGSSPVPKCVVNSSASS